MIYIVSGGLLNILEGEEEENISINDNLREGEEEEIVIIFKGGGQLHQ